jgi:hypothetical protein
MRPHPNFRNCPFTNLANCNSIKESSQYLKSMQGKIQYSAAAMADA